MAIYWKEQNRRYKVTQREKSTGTMSCPSCRGALRTRSYRQGQKILMCPACGFSIHPADILNGPDLRLTKNKMLVKPSLDTIGNVPLVRQVR